MNFFQRQEEALQSSRRMLLAFAAAVLLVVVAVCAAVLLGLILADGERWSNLSWADFWQHHRGALAICALLVVGTVLSCSVLRIRRLRRGGAELAVQLGGREITADCVDPLDRRLRNIVEELAIAACLPVPAIFVLDRESSINAFAAGYSPSDAAVAVTRGAIEKLNRDELQGVIAHEFSHILHGDMRLNSKMLGVLFGITALAVAARWVLERGRYARDSRGAGVVLVVAGLILAIGYVGVLCARVIKASVSRSREVLADASAVQFTRQRTGLAGALKKIAGLADGSNLQHARREEVSHMLFGEGQRMASWFQTHPPLLERIRALEPEFDQAALDSLSDKWRQSPPQGLEEDRLMDMAMSTGIQPLIDSNKELRPYPGSTAVRIASPQADDMRRASGLHNMIPPSLARAAHSSETAVHLLLALLVDRDRAVQARQLAEVAVEIDEDAADQVAALLPACQALPAALKLPLVALSFPALRRLTMDKLQRLIRCSDRLVHLDGKVSLFDYCMSRLLQRQVIEALQPNKFKASGRKRLTECVKPLADLFAIVAAYGHDDPDEMRRAYVAGLLSVLPSERFQFAPPKVWIPAMDAAMAELDQLDAVGKQVLVEGLVIAVGHDGRVTVEEAELLRTVCACLHCPLPPVIEQRGNRRS
ncbi:M48 family metallopeptidase [Pseudomarimonas arenosa]|uniref:M48 family metallopeptidase n=1 Tax=Pseudomarimonas arenosa TaxID=2774145 RepID=A0AAW3ZGK1_9GAMM|nr:M48 family metallopeptidase [Pseudomarimonas arenosa]MBD8524963.1 M48 family metallopeptidase [Pseudomarimonas arenosa]